MTDQPNLASALAAFQADLPRIAKSSQGNRGRYADLADVSNKVLPLLAKQGLSWSACPTVNDQGMFVLRYTLLHVSGESTGGDYPLPDPSEPPQTLGSAVTYSKRYALCAITGVAPDNDDDDGAHATENHRARPPQQRDNRNGQKPAQSPQVAAQEAAHLVAKAKLRKACADSGWDMHKVADLFAGQHQAELGETTNADLIDAFTKSLFSMPDSDLKAAVKAPA